MPAEGPSFLIAAAGKCTWISALSKKFLFLSENLWRFDLSQEIDVRTDSFITDPKCPVSSIFPDPGDIAVSIYKMRPPY